MTQLLERVVARLDRGDCPDSKWPDTNGEYWALCPYHHDGHSGSFSVSERGFCCFACGAEGRLGKLADDLGIAQGQRGKKPDALTLEEYARAKNLPVPFLRELGLSTCHGKKTAYVSMPYKDEDGNVVAVRRRHALTGTRRFSWRHKDSLTPYGLWRLRPDEQENAAAHTPDNAILLVEGESDAQTLWHHGFSALGIPGAATWRPEWADYVTGRQVYVWQEPGEGGVTFIRRIGESIPSCRVIKAPDGRKDISECHILGDDVPEVMRRLMREAVPYEDVAQEALRAEQANVKELARPLLECPDILGRMSGIFRALGLVGEERTAKLLYLVITSRLLEKPVSICVKGPSSGGKSFVVATVLKTFATSAYYARTSVSGKALVYQDEPLSHRTLVIYEAHGLSSPGATYLARTLLSEGQLSHDTVQQTPEGFNLLHLETQGPTGLILTTTAGRLDPEIETRLLSVHIRDDTAQTGAILASQAQRAAGRARPEPDLTACLALQRHLQLAEPRAVVIPYAEELPGLTAHGSIRMRRDFLVLLSLIAAHALLHASHRDTDSQGRILARLEDYDAVYPLVADLMGQATRVSVSPQTRETVEAVARLTQRQESVTNREVAEALDLDPSTISRRVKVAIEEGFLVNQQERKNRPTRLQIAAPLPVDADVIPPPERLRVCVHARGRPPMREREEEKI